MHKANILTFTINASVTPQAVANLREAVGWNRDDAAYPAAFTGYWATVSGLDATTGELRAWCAILSEGVRHAVLIDVIVHPAYQRQGIGRTLVARALEHIKAHGITIIHVDFVPEHARFYEQCGFSIGLGGIYYV